MTTSLRFKNAVETEAQERSIPIPRVLLIRAKNGYYHDFRSPLATPKLQLIEDLRRIGLVSIADEVDRGTYDESPEDEYRYIPRKTRAPDP